VGQVLFNDVIQKLGVLESDYFDLEYTNLHGVHVSQVDFTVYVIPYSTAADRQMQNGAFLVYMYYMHFSYQTSIFGKNCAYYIQIFTVLSMHTSDWHIY